jgi:hypothetical protein
MAYRKDPQEALLSEHGGEGGIRTPGPSPVNGFQDRRFRPLSHLSCIDLKGLYLTNPKNVTLFSAQNAPGSPFLFYRYKRQIFVYFLSSLKHQATGDNYTPSQLTLVTGRLPRPQP